MKLFLILFSIAVSIPLYSQSKAQIIEETSAYQIAENEKFLDPETTVLSEKDLKKFEGLKFYPIHEDYIVQATFIRTPHELPFLLRTNTARLPEYVKFGEVHFEIRGEKLKLNVYQNTTPSEDPKYKDYLFLPFTDLTNGAGSYIGGRFLEVFIPEGDTMLLNFNKAYNPYCAYSPYYSCPIPPAENNLSVRIEAGVKDYKKS